MEELSHLRLQSTEKKARDDLHLTPSLPQLIEDQEQSEQIPIRNINFDEEVVHPSIAKLREVRERVLGPWGIIAERVSRQRFPPRGDPYSVTMISAIAYEEVIATQLVEGGVDSPVFEHFIFRMLEAIRVDKQRANKRVVVLMDNATIHRHASVVATVMEMRAVLFFNPPYSPQLNPVEVLFKRVKAHIRERLPRGR